MTEAIRIGDEVICTTDTSRYFTEGKRYRVVSVSDYVMDGSVYVVDDEGDTISLFHFKKVDAKPRFITAWVHDGGVSFSSTGDTFMTDDEARAAACIEATREPGSTVAVFELRSLHTSSVEVKSEAA